MALRQAGKTDNSNQLQKSGNSSKKSTPGHEKSTPETWKMMIISKKRNDAVKQYMDLQSHFWSYYYPFFG